MPRRRGGETWKRTEGMKMSNGKKSRSLVEALREVGAEPGRVDAVARKVWTLAEGGNMQAVNFLADCLGWKDKARQGEEDMLPTFDFPL